MSPFADRDLTEFRPVCSEGGRQSRGGDVNEPLRDRRQIARIGEKIDQQRIPPMQRPLETALPPAAVEVLHGEHAGRFVRLAFRRRQVRVRPMLKSSRACRCSEAPAPGMHAPAEPRAAGALFCRRDATRAEKPTPEREALAMRHRPRPTIWAGPKRTYCEQRTNSVRWLLSSPDRLSVLRIRSYRSGRNGLRCATSRRRFLHG